MSLDRTSIRAWMPGWMVAAAWTPGEWEPPSKSNLRNVHQHVAEVQLHLASIMNLKSEGGHKNYVMRRNLRGK